MKKLLRKRLLGIPLFVILLVLLIPATVLAAYLIVTITGEVTVEEVITVSPETFTMSLYPGESNNQQISLTNASGVDITVTLTTDVTPVGLTVTVPATVLVAKNKTETFDIMVDAPLDIAPGTFTISVGVSRG